MTISRNMLGNTGVEVTELCIGTLIHGRLQANLSPAEGASAIARALDRGVNFIDAAKTYGTYAHVRKAVSGRRDVVIASKSLAKTGDDMRQDVEACLREMGRDTIDIFHLHLIRSDDDLRGRDGALDALLTCRSEGMIRAIGASAHGVAGTRAIVGCEEIDVLMPIVNRRGFGITDGSLEEMLEQVRIAREKGFGIYDMKPLGGGHLIGDIPSAIGYVRGLGLFHSISAGLKTPEEVDAMAGIFAGEPGAIEQARAMGRAGAGKRLVVYDFCEKCGNCVDACAQGAIALGDRKAVVDQDRCILCGYCAAACPRFAIRVI